MHRPYHAALEGLIGEAEARSALAVLIDWHSMPRPRRAMGERRCGGSCDVVLGDRFGAACAPPITALVEHELAAMGYRVARNAPYAGGYTTEHYGRPQRRSTRCRWRSTARSI